MNGMRLMRHIKNNKVYLVSNHVHAGIVAVIEADKLSGWVYVKLDFLKDEPIESGRDGSDQC